MYPDEALLMRHRAERDIYTKIIEHSELNEIRYFEITTSGIWIDVSDQRMRRCHGIVETADKLIERIESKYA
jgi:hypothetical protein